MPASRRERVPEYVNNGAYRIDKKLGEGSFGEVYLGRDVRPERKGALVAVKVEETQSPGDPGSLRNEALLLEMLRRPEQRQGFVELFHCGKQGRFTVLVMELLGKSLEDCVQASGGRLGVGSSALIAEQAIQRMEYLHSKGIVHRDIKPENFMMGRDRRVHHIYLIDFGLSVRYWDDRWRHVSMSTTSSLTGTARYASINAHKGWTQSRRDDLEAIGYMLMYFLIGKLPWSGLKAKTPEEKFRLIAETKEHYMLKCLDQLCKGYPPEFRAFLQYARSLKFKEKPDYTRLKDVFEALRKRRGVRNEWDFEWLSPKDIIEGEMEMLESMVEEGTKLPRFPQPDEVRRRDEGSFRESRFHREGPRESDDRLREDHSPHRSSQRPSGELRPTRPEGEQRSSQHGELRSSRLEGEPRSRWRGYAAPKDKE